VFAQVFIVLVVLLVTFVVVVTYICILPVKLSHSVSWAVYHCVVGHWLLINVVFHYFKAAFTNPGHVPEVCFHASCEICFCHCDDSLTL